MIILSVYPKITDEAYLGLTNSTADRDVFLLSISTTWICISMWGGWCWISCGVGSTVAATIKEQDRGSFSRAPIPANELTCKKSLRRCYTNPTETHRVSLSCLLNLDNILQGLWFCCLCLCGDVRKYIHGKFWNIFSFNQVILYPRNLRCFLWGNLTYSLFIQKIVI